MVVIDDHIMALAGSALLQLSEPSLCKGGLYNMPWYKIRALLQM